ncbi:mucin-2 isoform X7 [Accipiter gentilis]|uniref:mucin-2 isoform X7 n=1 Tax=Astur gentilis TaxID=8957 RepID=UPI0021104043|nr:mucin-2 isoform X7 [Accipiter gentilis]
MGRTRNHGHYVCSTWGNNHFKTFDGDIYQFPGICEYNFASDCQESYKEFSVHIQRALNSNNHPEIQYILITMKDFTVYLRPKLAVVDGRIVKTPYYSSGLLIESNDIYTKVYAKLGLILIWNQEDALMVELDSKFNNHTCGLCGDYNGVPIYNEFINGVASYNSITYGNLQKISRPNTKCEDPDETQALPSCNEHRNECERLLTSSAFADCRLRLNLELYIQACMQDKCACNGNEDSFCLCSTISEYSRQCSHAGGRPGEWRTQYFCPKTCPDTMIYRESSSPCMDTCSHLEISSLCEEHYMDGCFCPEGTVYDDITEKGCILASQCHCKLHGKEYSPGESITNECEECTCDSGRWTCKDLPCPGTCSVEGGSHITTFDGKKYTFHGDCYYVLAKGTVNDSHALLAELSPCGSTDRQTCLKTVVLLADHKKNVVVFRSDGSVLLNEMTVNVPHVSASFSVFKPSSYYLVAQTSFGLQLQIQLFPVMQLFVTVDQSVQGKLQGLCGNFNGMEGDDFKTTSGLVEATGSAFANTWKAQSTCTDQVEKLEDPCSLSTESANYAEHWCSLLKNSEGPFARCHLIIDPSEYYKKCKYDTCLCEDNEECLCAALSSYSRACAFKGIILGGWRKNVCTSEMSACPGNQIFLYNLTMCQQTCRSLAGGEKHCLQDFPPMDGCGCPYNTYLDNQDTCVPISKCPCYYKGSYLEPGEYVTKDGERCVCRNAKVQCTSVTIKMKNTTECSSNKMYFDCNASPKWTSQTPLQLSCHTPRTDHFQAECVSGCVCPEGLFDDGKGGCVEEKDCPCIHNNQWYSPGQKIAVDCNTCTCQKGLWTCTEDVCYGTCMIYGSGHYITFDGKFYDFDGSCDYVATQDFCGDKNSSGSFSIITENVPCGTTGVTCSKAIKMFLGKTELKLENKDYKEIQRDIGDDVRYWNRTVGLYLVIEASNGVMLIWDKKTTVFIKLTPDYKGKVCGLCGNFDDKSNNDFTTRSGLQETNALKFGNSWKQSSMCPDITQEIKPCDVKPHRKSWAEKECSIIRSEVFKICHSKVDPIPFYEACVHDACSCDSGGDCECFCSAVAAYAQECTKAQACVFWRTPDICPIFCDYYNPRNECDWHYEPCGSNVTTCRMINNVSTNFSVPYLEGCYPRCPKDKPVYNEETKECVPEDQCWCYINGTHVPPGSEIPTEENCTKCVCGPSGSIQCTPIPGCPCVINGTSYEVGEIVAQIQDGNICITYICAENGSIVVGSTYPCPTSTSPTTVSTSFPTSTLTTTVVTTSPPVTTTPCFGLICNWTQWFDVSKPEEDGGDYETYDAIRKEHGNKICEAPEDIECRAKDNPDMSLEELGQKVECNVTYGLICKNEEQDATMWQLCYNYEIRVNCCEWSEISCETTSTLSPTPTATSTTTSTTVPITTTVRQSTAVTTMPIPTPTITSKFTSSVTTPVTSTSPAPPSSTTRTVSPPPVSTTAPTPTPSEPPSSTATTTMPPRSTTSSTLGTTTMVSGTPAPTPTTATTSMPTPTYTTTSSPPDCDCIWTDWIDVSYPNSSDRNSGDYETFENILKNDSSWVCAKAENISCRAEKFPHIPIADLGQKVECSVNTGLICNNSDQVIGGIIPMPVCLNYEISVCCIPNIPQCITSTTTSTTTAPPSSTTRTVSPPPVSTTAPTPTPSEPPSSTATTTMPPRSTTSSTLGTTTMVSGTPAPTPTTATTSMPTPTYTTTSSPPDCDCIWTDWIDVSYPNSSDRNSGDYETFENILKNDSSWVCAKAENISCRAEKFPHIPIADLGQKVECSVNTGLICNNSDQVIGGIIPMPVCLNYEISVCCIPNIPQCITSTTTSTTTAPPSSTTRTVSPPPVSTTAPTPTPSEPPSSTATTTMPPRSTTSSTLGTTTMVSGTPAPTPTTATTSMPTPTYTTTSSPPDCDCIWTDWIDVSYPNSSDRNSGDYETFENILKNDSSWVCAKAENISCRAEKFPHIPIADLGQKVECSVNTGLICNNSDQVIGGIIPMPVCLNYEISVCCIPNIPQCITSTTTSTTTAPPSSTTRTVSPPPVSTTAPTPTPSEPPSSTATTTMPPRSTTSSTLGTTTMVSGTPAPTPTTATTSMPTPTYTTTSSPPEGTTPESGTLISTTVTPSATPQPTTRTTEIQSTVSTTGTTIQQSKTSVSTSPVTVSTSGVTETGPTTKTTTSGPTPHSTTTVMETSSHETSTTGTGSPPTGPPSSTTSTTTSGPSSPMSTASTTVSPPPVSTSPVTVSTSGVTETGPTTKTTTSGPTPHSTTTVMETSSHETSTTGTGSPPTGPPSSTTSTTTSGPSSPMSTASTTVSPPPVSTSPVTVSTSGVTETGPTTKTTTSGPTPHSTTTVMETSSHETSTTGTGSPPTGPPSSTTSTTTSGPSSPMSTASTTVSPPPVSTSPVTVSTSGVTETGPTTKTTTSGPTPHSTTTVMETSSHETSTTGTGSPPTGPPSSTTSTTTSGPSSPMSTASTTVSPPPVSTSPVTVSTSGVTETGPTTKTTTSGPTPHSTTTVMETSSHETSTTGTGSPPTGPPSSTTSTTTSGPSSPMSTASTTVSPPPVSTSPVTVSTSGVTETGPTTKTTTSGPTPHSTTTVMETSSHETSTTGTGSPPTGPPSSTTSTTTSGPSSPMSTASTTVSPPPVSTSPVTVSTSGVTETGPTTKTTTSGPTPHSTTTVMETSSHETSTTGTGSPPTGPPSSTTSTTTSGPSSPMSTASTTVSPPPVSTSPVTVSTSGVTETGPTTKTTTSGPTPHSTTTVMETSSHETSTTGTGSPPTGPPSSTTSTTTSGPSSPMSTASTTVSPPPVSTSPVTVSTSGVTETGPTTKTTTSGPTPHSTTTVMETSSHETSTTGTGSPPTGPPSSTTSTTTSGPSSPMSTASTTVSPPPVSTSPVTVSTSGVTETGPTTKTTTSGPTPHSTTTVMETSSHETSTTGTGSPPTGPPSSTTSTTTSGPSSPMSTASTTVSPPPVSTSPVTVSTSGVTETGPTTKTTTSGPTPHSTTTVMETSSHETSTTGTGSPPTGPPSSTTSTTTSGPSSPMSTASTTVSPPPVSTSPVTVSTSGVTETGPTTKTTTSGPTPHSTTTVMETSSHETSTTGTGSPPTGPPSSTTSTTTSGPSSPMSTASTTVSPPPVSTSPVTVSTSGVTETGPTTKTTTSGPTPHSTTTVMETSSHETSTTGTGSPPTGPPSSTTSTTTSGPSSPMSTASTTVSPPPVSTSPVTVSTSGVTETGSTATSGPTLSGPTSHSTTTVTVTGSTMPTTATRTTPTRSTVITTTMTSGRSSIESTAITTLSPPSVSTSIMPVTTSGTTPTESFTTTSGTTSRNFTTITATTTTSSSEYFPPGSTSTSGPTATSSSVTITGSSTYSTVTPLSASSSTTSPPPTTPGRNCSVFPNESYAPGESWWICDCIKAICIEDNIIQVVPVICNPPPKPTCANGLSPVQVIDEDGCCWHWECDCYCTGWGDPHYMTFDGLYYSYQGNCTYVLVEEIHKKVDNFGVYIDNYHCDTRDVVSCPRTLIVRHETQEVRMATVKPNTLQVEVTVNKQAVALPYKKFGLSIYESGINRVVEIPELKMNVTYNGLSFSIRMPYSLFGNNTHGQCGTCNNNTADDCMLPNGNIAENCETMADHWQVVDPSKPQCSPGLIPTKAPSTTPRQPCKESSICELLLGSLFEPCHGFVQPEKYYAACVFDSCVLPNLDLECSSLQTYAATCADQSVCIDWRSHTNGVCSYKCPSDKEYRACGPIKEITCKSSQQNETSTKQVEGCFCPNGTMLYDSGVDVCVKTCGCVGVDKIPREFGEKFTIDCQDCICVEGGNGIVCEPHECAEQNKTSCDGEGFYEVNEVNSEDSCCPIVTCKCNTSLCTSKAPKCTLGFEVHSHIPSGQCCPVYQCVPKRVCVHQNAEFLPNSSVFVDKCQNCFCTNEVNISTQLNIILCEHIPCNTYCEPGYESQPVKGECCGRCVQTKCVIHTSHNSDLILSPGEFKNDPYNNCTIYSCVNIHNQLISSTSEITCPAFNEESCKPGTITFLPNGCCRTCAPLDSPTPCSVRQRKDFIVYKGCRSVDRVVMTECEGTCGTSSLYSAEANSMDHSCSCCRESRTTVREVELKCPTGHSVSHKYIYVESCSCQDTECSSSQSSELQSTEENDKASILNRIKRAISLTAK